MILPSSGADQRLLLLYLYAVARGFTLYAGLSLPGIIGYKFASYSVVIRFHRPNNKHNKADKSTLFSTRKPVELTNNAFLNLKN